MKCFFELSYLLPDEVFDGFCDLMLIAKNMCAQTSCDCVRKRVVKKVNVRKRVASLIPNLTVQINIEIGM